MLRGQRYRFRSWRRRYRALLEHSLEHQVTERGTGGEAVHGAEAQPLADDLDTDGVVRRGTRHDQRLDPEAFPEERRAAPGRDRIVRGEDDCGERSLDLGIVEN